MKIKKEKTLLLIIITLSILLIGLNYFSENYGVNISNSIERGIYKYLEKKEYKKGDIVIFEKNDELKKLGKAEIPFLKKLIADENSYIEIKNDFLYIDGENFGKIYKLRGMKTIGDNYKINKNCFLALSKVDKSFDSRYFGEICQKEILKGAKLIYEIK